MVKQVQHVGHNTAGANAYTGAAREITVDTGANELRVHDGVTAGGHRVPNLTANDLRYFLQANDVDIAATKFLGFRAGAVGTPGLRVVGDTDTGIYAPAGDQLAIALGGVQRLLMTSSLNTLASALTITTGPLTVTSGGAVITAGGLTVSAGGAAITGGLTLPGTPLAVAYGGTGSTTAAAARTAIGVNIELVVAEAHSGSQYKAFTSATHPSLFDGTYSRIEIYLDDFQVSTDTANIIMQFSDDDGATYEADAGDYLRQIGSGESGSATYSHTQDTSTNMLLCADVRNLTTQNNCMRMELMGAFNRTKLHKMMFAAQYQRSGGNMAMEYGFFRFQTEIQITGLRIGASSGNHAAGYRIYGYRAANP